jgi:hypothetical protein
MEQVIIQDCGCIALPESVATAVDLRRGMTLDVVLTVDADAVLLTPHRSGETPANGAFVATPGCVILPPSR